MFSWGDNDHGQQGNGTTIVNRTPARVLGLEGHRITRVACGSSHSIAWAEFNASQPLLVDPVDFSRLRDILGASYVRNEFERKKTKEHVGQHIKRQRPSLSKEVLQLKTDNEKQKALLVILESLQVSYVRDGVITVLSHLFSIPIKDGEHGNEWRSKQTQAWGDSTQPERTDSSSEENTLFRLEIAEVKCLVDLLKLGLSGRLDEEQIECLTSIIVQVARRNKEVRN